MGNALKLDGKYVAEQVKQQLCGKLETLQSQGKSVGLGTLLVGDDPGSLKYVAGKHRDCLQVGIQSIRAQLPADATQADILEAVQALNDDPACTGFIVQLPLPDRIDATAVLEAVNPSKDADGLHPFNVGRLVLHPEGGIDAPLPCTPLGIVRLLQFYHIDLRGKNVCILGRGITVGRPLSLMLSQRAVNATVTICHSGTRDIAKCLRQADVIVAAMGRAHFVKPEHCKPGVVLIDVGVSRAIGEDGKSHIQGDVDPACYALASAYTPNPGGVGPMTRAMLLSNVIDIAQRQLCAS